MMYIPVCVCVMLSEQKRICNGEGFPLFPLLIALEGPHREALIDECHTNGRETEKKKKKIFGPVYR